MYTYENIGRKKKKSKFAVAGRRRKAKNVVEKKYI